MLYSTRHCGTRGGGAVPWRARDKAFLRIATFGDSTADYGNTRDPESADTEIFHMSPEADSLKSGILLGDKVALMQFLPTARFVFNGGVGGDTTTTMLGRSQLPPSPTRKSIEDVLNSYPDVVIVRAGSINDITGLSPTGDGVPHPATMNNIFNRHTQIVARFAANPNILVIDEGIAGYYSSGPGTASVRYRQACVMVLNQMYAENSVFYRNVIFLDPVGVTCNLRGAFLYYGSPDQIHLTRRSQRRLASAEAHIITSVAGAGPRSAYWAPNLFPNADFSITSDDGYGLIPSGVEYGCSGADRAAAQIEVVGNSKYATVEIRSTSSSPSGSIYIKGPNFQAGVKYGIEMDFLLEPLASLVAFTEIGLTARFDTTRSSDNARTLLDVLAAPFPSYMGEPIGGHIVFPPIQMDYNYTPGDVNDIYISVSSPSSLSFKIGIANIRIVPLT